MYLWKWLSAWLLTVKMIVNKGRPQFLKISKEPKSETAIPHKSKTKKYPAIIVRFTKLPHFVQLHPEQKEELIYYVDKVNTCD